MRDVALAPMGPHWKRMRRICMEHLLTTKRLESFTAQRAEETRYLIADVYKRAECGKLINLREVLGAFSMNNVTRMLLGKQFFGPGSVVGPKEAQEFMHITHKLFRLLGVIYLGDYLPFWRWVDPYGCEKEMKDVEKRVDKFHTKITEEHRRTKREREDNNNDNGEMDFVEVLLSLPGDNGKEHIEIKALIQWDMIAAATDTSAVTNEWAMAESILRETFRMHPAGPFLIPHESVRPTTVNGYYIPAKTRVFINTHGLGRNTKIWDDIDEFRPERHWPVDGSGRVEISRGADYKILPFSAGKRKCPGAPLGVTMVLMALARLFHCFDWTSPENIDTVEVYGMTMPKAKPLWALAKPRLAAHLYK
ncbi:unnamed protein product [Brassica napus]|uniref:(rape) hypothetical protein n=1 Tax=Brassica napus TaxID=3708 RepID=A0A816PVU5_BRANA|nr:unnamed protein product [Brassica napus]